MEDEKLYLEATNEVEGENRGPALWAKTMTVCDGDERKAKYEYIRCRVRHFLEKNEYSKKDKQDLGIERTGKPTISPEESAKEIVSDKNEYSDQDLMRKYGISFDGEVYRYKDYRYEKLSDAINYAKLKKEKSKSNIYSDQSNVVDVGNAADYKGRTIIKRILLTIPFVLFITLIVGIIKELMEPGVIRAIIIISCFLSVFKFWSWLKN